jgi:hypothetical protein
MLGHGGEHFVAKRLYIQCSRAQRVRNLEFVERSYLALDWLGTIEQVFLWVKYVSHVA